LLSLFLSLSASGGLQSISAALQEKKLLRMEMGKLAEEVHLLRQEFKGDKSHDAST